MKHAPATWRHHYVPQFYLRQWSVGGFLWQYSRARGNVGATRVSTRSTGFARHLYTLEPEAHTSLDPDGLEKCLARSEGKAAAVFKKMLALGSGSLTDEDKRTWSRFMCLQVERHPHRMHEATKIADQLRAEFTAPFRGDQRYAVVAKLFTPEVARNLVRGMLVAPDSAKLDWEQNLALWTWTVTTQRGQFITSDKPVMLDFGRGAHGSVVSCITMSLSPNHLLWCTPGAWKADLCNDWFQEMASLFNVALVACGPRFVYAARPLGEFSGPRFEKMLDRFLLTEDGGPAVSDAGR